MVDTIGSIHTPICSVDTLFKMGLYYQTTVGVQEKLYSEDNWTICR